MEKKNKKKEEGVDCRIFAYCLEELYLDCYVKLERNNFIWICIGNEWVVVVFLVVEMVEKKQEEVLAKHIVVQVIEGDQLSWGNGSGHGEDKMEFEGITGRMVVPVDQLIAVRKGSGKNLERL